MDAVYGPLLRTDAARCAELEAMLFGDDPWPGSRRSSENLPPVRPLASPLGGRDSGGLRRNLPVGGEFAFEYEIHTIGVDPEFQGRGIGRRMPTELLDVAALIRSCILKCVPTTNPRSRSTGPSGSPPWGCASATTA